jgi:dihydroorotate dehydrogenase electron transfer subunit
MKQVKATVSSIVEAMPGTYLVRLEAPPIAGEARPGQFVMVRCGEDMVLPRPLSIHRVDGGYLALLFSKVGKGTDWLANRKKGESLDVFGPLGNGFTIDPRSKNLLLVAGGMGIAPLYFLAEAAGAGGKKVTLINGARTRDCLLAVSLPQKLFNSGMLPANIEVVCATDDGSEGFKGLATRLMPHYLDKIDQVFACGPVAMYRAMALMPELKKIPVQVSMEIVMGCGVGVCYGCTIKTKSGLKQVCKDGPVFGMEKIDWEKPLDVQDISWKRSNLQT